MPTVTGRATDFITFTRTSNATVTGADGRIRWAGHNLLTNSESFDASAWTKESGVTVVANAVAAPNGTTTADQIDFSTGNIGIYQSVSVLASTPYTFGVWIRGDASGTINVGPASGGSTSAVNITTSWQYITGTINTAATSNGPYIRRVSGDLARVYLWGAHLYRSDLGGMVLNPARGDAYYPTTPRNLLGNTEDFSAASWTKGQIAVTSNNILAPNGLQTADRVAADANVVEAYVRASTSQTNSGVYRLSVYAKVGNVNFVRLRNLAISGAPSVWFNLSTGVVATQGSGATGSITAVGDGWYRCSIVGTNLSSITNNLIDIAPAAADNSTAVSNGDFVYLWGAQLSDSASLDAYSPVYGAAVTSAAYYAPRLDYDANGSALGLLVEEQRTNFLLHTADFTNASGWFASGATPTSNDVIAPDGTQSADKIVFTSTSGLILQDYTTTTSATYCGSVWLRADSNTTLILRVQQSGGGSASITCNITTSWQRFDVAYVATSPTFIRFSILANSNTPTVYAWGAQLEAGSFATSYIPNGAATSGATRTADVASVSTQAFPYSATEGTVVVNVSNGTARTGGSFALCTFDDGNGGYDNSRQLYFQNDTGDVRAYESSNNVVAVDQIAYNGPPNTSLTGKQAYTYKANDFASAFNGAAVVQLSTSGNPALNIRTMGLGSDFNASASGAVTGRVYIRQITYIPRRLSNSELQARTA